MAKYTGTAGDDSWTVVQAGTFTLDGLGGTDTLNLGTSLLKDYVISRQADGAVQIDSVSGASASLHATLYNIENLVFNSGRETVDLSTFFAPRILNGTDGNDRLAGGRGIDQIDGGAGIDTVVYAGNRANFTLAAQGAAFILSDKTGAEGVNLLRNAERLQFADASVALDIHGNGGQAYRLYQAAFNRTPDQAGLGFWIRALDIGVPLKDVAAGFVMSAEWQALYGTDSTDRALLAGIYENVLHRTPDDGGLQFWLDILGTHAASLAEVLVAFSEGFENQAALIEVIGKGVVYTPYGT
ncbi:MAG: DUF4214 domain-containing protein [Pseudomonadota bacterium]